MKIKQVSWNLFGLGVPLVFALLTIPVLTRTLGMERFGLLSLAWGLVNYAGIFDLGIGRATTQYIAELRGRGCVGDTRGVLSVAIKFTLLTGTIGAVLICIAALSNVQSLIKHSSGLGSEITVSVLLLAFALPIQAMSATYRGVNEAFENFQEISLIRIFLGATTFFGPLAISLFTIKLPWLVASLLFSRMIALALYKYVANRVIVNQSVTLVAPAEIIPRQIRSRLFSFAGWVTVSNIISPILVQADRFAIAAMISATAVAAYTLPYMLVVQSLVIAGAVSNVTFPTITRLRNEDPHGWIKTFNIWTLFLTVVMALVLLIVTLVLPYFLPWWAGRKLPVQSVLVGEILCIGVFANSIAVMYYARLQAFGRSDITAKLQMFELLIYVFLLPSLILRYGIEGAAIAWSARMAFDAIALAYCCQRYAV